MHKALQVLPQKRTIWLLKHVSGYCATGKQMKQWKKRETNECPMCTAVEDHHHITQCKSQVVSNLWSEQIEQYETQLMKMGAPYDTSQAMIQLINEYRGTMATRLEFDEPTLQAAVTKQRRLGSNCFIEGLLVEEWKAHIVTFLTPKQK